MLRNAKYLMFSVAFVAFNHAAPSQASPAACANLAGTTIFIDMLYGVAGGGLLSGLYMAAEDNFHRSGSKTAYGALAGSALGIGIGITEVFSSKCQPATEQVKTTSSTSSGKFRVFATPATASSASAMGINFSLAI